MISVFTELSDKELCAAKAKAWEGFHKAHRTYCIPFVDLHNVVCDDLNEIVWDLEEEFLARMGLFHRSEA